MRKNEELRKVKIARRTNNQSEKVVSLCQCLQNKQYFKLKKEDYENRRNRTIKGCGE